MEITLKKVSTCVEAEQGDFLLVYDRDLESFETHQIIRIYNGGYYGLDVKRGYATLTANTIKRLIEWYIDVHDEVKIIKNKNAELILIDNMKEQ